MTLDTIRDGGKVALAQALAQLERHPYGPESQQLLDKAYAQPIGHVIGITGPPGVGKSTLTNRLITAWRGQGKRVAVIAVDPSSRRSGGALLGDRTRFTTDPLDQDIFIRSMAARDRLGGLAGLTIPAMILMRALYDIVLIETVGVGQSETDIVGVADTVLFCVQPASGDSLQFIKAGIVEIPHMMAVTKADLGASAKRAVADMKGALNLAGQGDPTGWTAPVLLVSAQTGSGVDSLIQAFAEHLTHLLSHDLEAKRRTQAHSWLEEAIRDLYGRRGLAALRGRLVVVKDQSPFSILKPLMDHADQRWS